LRHAEAERDSPHGEDHTRALTPAGSHEAAKLGAYWRQHGVHFDKIIASPAVRTMATAEAVAEQMAHKMQDISSSALLQEGRAEAILSMMHTWHYTWQNVLIVTHAPVASPLLVYLAGRQVLELPTCSYAYIRLNALTWQEVVPMTNRLKAIVNSKDLAHFTAE